MIWSKTKLAPTPLEDQVKSSRELTPFSTRLLGSKRTSQKARRCKLPTLEIQERDAAKIEHIGKTMVLADAARAATRNHNHRQPEF